MSDSTLFFTSDLHLQHARLLTHAPHRAEYTDVNSVDEAIIERWNAKIKPTDTVWLLGDVGLGNWKRVLAAAEQLHGRINLIPGNHDSSKIIKGCVELGWTIHPPRVTIKVSDPRAPVRPGTLHEPRRMIVMDHFPLLTWENAHYGSWHMHGHSHGNIKDTGTTRLDVGLDAHPTIFAPLSFAEISTMFSTRTYTPVDHHTVRQGS